MICMHRPATFESEEHLTREFASTRWTHHRLLDFEAEHQRVLDATADQIAPGIVRVGRILARLSRRARRAERTTEGQWYPSPRPELSASLRIRLSEMRLMRNADLRWTAALKWADEPVGEPKTVRRRRAKPVSKICKRKTETDEAFAKRFDLLTHDETEEHYAVKAESARRDTRRDVYRKKLYQERRIYWGTWNALVRSVDQARKDVIGQRARGAAAEIRRPKYRDPISLSSEAGGFRIVERSSPWWTIEMRVGTADEWVRMRAKCGNWHQVPEGTSLRSMTLTRRKDGERWSYSISIIVDMMKPLGKKKCAESRVVAFDWGHRAHGHDREREGIRVFTWLGDDGEHGEIIIPAACRSALDEIDALKSRLDTTYDTRKVNMSLPHRNRYLYRRALMRSGVRTVEETDWLRWEMRYERRIAAHRKRVVNVRREVYLRAVRELRTRYATFAFEDESVHQIKTMQKDKQRKRRQRSTRDLAARYEFTSICERSGAKIITVSARNTTRECPDCGQLSENGPELLIACLGCGRIRDKDRGASRVILGRAKEALANHAA